MSGFTKRQMTLLRSKLDCDRVRARQSSGGTTLSYVEGWFVIAEANRIFGFDGWERETVASQCVWQGREGGSAACSYTARVRMRVHAGGRVLVREGSGAGHGRSDSIGEAHANALKEAETDATKRALVTFGNRFGLALYDPLQRGVRARCVAPKPTSPAGATEQVSRSSEGSDLSRIAPMLVRPVRRRDREHLRFVSMQECMICGRSPCHAHHVNYLQPRGIGQKASDEFTVPLCAIHHRALHDAGNEVQWWTAMNVDPAPIALSLWKRSRSTAVEDEVPTDASNWHCRCEPRWQPLMTTKVYLVQQSSRSCQGTARGRRLDRRKNRLGRRKARHEMQVANSHVAARPPAEIGCDRRGSDPEAYWNPRPPKLDRKELTGALKEGANLLRAGVGQWGCREAAVCSYVARIRITVFAGDRVLRREGSGAGQGRSDSVGAGTPMPSRKPRPTPRRAL